MSRKVDFFGSVRYASDGLQSAFRDEPNFRVHVVFAVLAIIASIVLRLSIIEWGFILLSISFVLIMELFNTAIENIVDMVSPKYHENAKIAKDVCAAAVLIAATCALSMGIIVFIPKVMSLFS